MLRPLLYALLFLGFTSTARAYRTAADRSDLGVAFHTPPRWSTGNTVPFFLQLQDPFAGPSATIESAIQRGFSAWYDASCAAPQLAIIGYTSEPQDGINTISWSSQHTAELPPDTIAITDIIFEERSSGWEIIEADILVNDESVPLSASLIDGRHIRLDRVVAHEAGHALGLAHPCRADNDAADREAEACGEVHQSSLMHPFYHLDGAAGLSEDDREGLCAIYGDVSVSFEPTCSDIACRDPGSDVGAVCDAAHLCSSGVCIITDGLGYCSSRCAGDGASCTHGFSCEAIRDAGYFCIMTKSSACSASELRGDHPSTLLLLFLLVAMAHRTRRKQALPCGF